MNKQEAINFCQSNLPFWPKTTWQKFPEGWRWVVKHEPYSDYEYLLISDDNNERIFEKDVAL